MLYGRQHCHLCQDMHVALEKLRGELDFELAVVDIDGDPLLVEKHGPFVPVLMAGQQELCHYRLDPDKVRDFCHGRL